MATTKTTAKTTKKPAASTLTQSADIQLTLTQIVWPMWLKVSVFLMATYSGLMILSFFYTLYVLVARSQAGF